MTQAAFAAWFTGTVVLTRVALWLRPTASPTVCGFRLHHWMFGAALGVAVAVLYWHLPLARMPYLAAVLSAVGAGLFIDEATYLAIGGRTHKDYLSRASLAGTAVLVALIDVLFLAGP